MRRSKVVRQRKTIAEEKRLSKEHEELLRREATAKLVREQERRVHAEAKSRAAQAALDIEAEQGRAQGARVASPEEEMARLSLVKDSVEQERGNLVSVIFESDEEGLAMAQREEEQLGMLLHERLGLQKMRHGHVCRHQEREAPSGRRPTHLALLLLLNICRVSLIT